MNKLQIQFKRIRNLGGVLQDRLLYVVAFAAFFIFIGQAIPEFYFRYLDGTSYYAIELPIPVTPSQAVACQSVTLVPRVHSRISTESRVNIQLTLVTVEGNFVVQNINSHYDINITNEPEGEVLPVTFDLPCDVQPGAYYYKGHILFDVRGNEKSFDFHSKQFEIVEETSIIRQDDGN